jgi:hypothetical protein
MIPLDAKARAFVEQIAAQTAAADPPLPPLDQIPPAAVREMFNGLLLTMDSPGDRR